MKKTQKYIPYKFFNKMKYSLMNNLHVFSSYYFLKLFVKISSNNNIDI